MNRISNDLINEAIIEYENKKLNIKLWNRQWKAIEMYEKNASYQDVLQTLFGAKSSAYVASHKKNSDFNTLINN